MSKKKAAFLLSHIVNVYLVILLTIFVLAFSLEGITRLYLKNHDIKFDKAIGDLDQPIYSPDLLYLNKPYGSRLNKIEPFQALAHFNCYGFRDYDYSFDEQPNIYRIVVLGDSYIYGFALEPSQTFPKILENHLNGISSHGKVFEVINLAIPSYGPPEYYALTKGLVKNYKPDLVIIGFSLSNEMIDSLDAKINHNYRLLRSIPDMVVPYSLNQYLKQNSYLWMILLDRYYSYVSKYDNGRPLGKNINEIKEKAIYETQIDSGSPEMKEAWQLTENYLKSIDLEVKKMGAKLIIADIPTREQTIPDDWERLAKGGHHVDELVYTNPAAQRIMENLCVKNNWNCLQLNKEFLSQYNPATFFLDDNNDHFNFKGQSLVAQSVFKFLTDEGFVKP